jgi:hypothetical protein
MLFNLAGISFHTNHTQEISISPGAEYLPFLRLRVVVDNTFYHPFACLPLLIFRYAKGIRISGQNSKS